MCQKSAKLFQESCLWLASQDVHMAKSSAVIIDIIEKCVVATVTPQSQNSQGEVILPVNIGAVYVYQYTFFFFFCIIISQ